MSAIRRGNCCNGSGGKFSVGQLVSGQWSVVSGQWSVVSGQWAGITGPSDLWDHTVAWASALVITHEMGCCRWHSAAASQGIHRFRLAKRSQSNPPMVIGECVGCEFRNSFGSSDHSPSGVGRGYVVRGRWPTSGRGAACSGEPSAQQKGAFPGLRP